MLACHIKQLLCGFFKPIDRCKLYFHLFVLNYKIKNMFKFYICNCEWLLKILFTKS